MRHNLSMGTPKKSLAETHPALALEADGWNPKTVTAGSNKKIVGKFDGYSEAWSEEVFPVNSIKELMSMVEVDEEQKNKKGRNK